MTCVGDFGAKIAQMKDDLEATTADEVEREQFVPDFAGNCEKTKDTNEWASHKEMQGQEMLALAR